ncbi:MAG: tRNA (adenosine(37)-N6)-threonylcarbamoyltransferase complex transferase subunit TsaD [Acidobacteriota bacterium]
MSRRDASPFTDEPTVAAPEQAALQPPVKTLGIETSCDETAVAVLDPEGRILCNLVSSQVAVHAPYLGVVPELAARHHVEALDPMLSEADRIAGLADAGLVAVTRGPGLIGSLLVGTCFASAYAWSRGLPIVGVDHLEGHLVSPYLSLEGLPAREAADPTVTLVVSGGHSSYFLLSGGRARPLNRTRDDAAGEVFDKVAAALGLGYPGGPVIDRLAEHGDPTTFRFAVPRIKDPSGDLDFSFSGLKSAVIRAAEGLAPLPLADPQRPGQAILDLLASFRRTIATWLLSPLETLFARHAPRSVSASGGVAGNRELRAGLERWGRAVGVEVVLPPVALTTDNAAMVARAGQLGARRGAFDDPRSLQAYPRAPWKGGADAKGRVVFPCI